MRRVTEDITMKKLLIPAYALLMCFGGVTSSLADDMQEQLMNLWLTTGDAHYARLAGVPEAQITAQKALPPSKIVIQD
jgi:hypothetical protein